MNVLNSIILSCLVSLIYVASLYVWKHRVRNDPLTMKLRFVSVTVTTGLSLMLVRMFVPHEDRQFCSLLGSCPSDFSLMDHLILPLLITALLFLGTIVVFIDTYTWEELIQEMRNEMFDLAFVRNYIVAPITEETTFRAIICAFFIGTGLNKLIVLFVSATVFAAAHSHHYFFQSVEGSGDVSLSLGLFQMMYTFLFGLYSGSLYLKTGSLLTSISLHVFCNFLGFPDFDTLNSRKKYRYSTIFGFASWLIFFPMYLTMY